MPFAGSAPNQVHQRTDGTRTGEEVWQEAKAAAVKVRADAHDTHDQDVSESLSALWLRNGGNQPTADLTMGGFKLTGVGAADARDQFATVTQVQDNDYCSGTDAGTNTRTVTLAPAITGYALGHMFLLKAASANTGAATLNANSVGAKTIKKGKAGSLDLSSGDIGAGRMGLYAYDGTNFQMLNAPEFPSGTVMLFVQTSAPTGWTKGSTHNNKALRVVTGTASDGGTFGFSSVFTSRTPAGTVGDTTLTANQIPSHQHRCFNTDASGTTGTLDGDEIALANAGGAGSAAYGMSGSATAATLGLTSSTGGGASHTHTFTGTALDFDVLYVDVIIATKD